MIQWPPQSEGNTPQLSPLSHLCLKFSHCFCMSGMVVGRWGWGRRRGKISTGFLFSTGWWNHATRNPVTVILLYTLPFCPWFQGSGFLNFCGTCYVLHQYVCSLGEWWDCLYYAGRELAVESCIFVCLIKLLIKQSSFLTFVNLWSCSLIPLRNSVSHDNPVWYTLAALDIC